MKLNLYSIMFFALSATLFALFGGKGVQAQQLGLANSNYSGIHSLYTNPSGIADSRHGFYFSLVSFDAGITNNYLRYEAPVSLYKLYRDGLKLRNEYIKENLNGRQKLVMAGVNLTGPSFMLRLSPKHSIAVTSRVRGGLQISNLSEEVARIYKVATDDANDLLNKNYDKMTMNLNANVYSELGVSYARIILDKENHFLKGGFTLKKLAGGYSSYFMLDDTQLQVQEVKDDAGNEDNVLNFDKIRAKYGYVSEDALGDLETSDIINLLTGKDSPGKGWGADLGFTYEYRPDINTYRSRMDGEEVVDQEKNKYKVKFGASLMNIGGITYNDPSTVKAYDIDRSNKKLSLSAFDGVEDTESAIAVINEALLVTDADKRTAFRSGLPTAVNLNVDYNVGGAFYVNATLIQGLRGKNAIGMRQNSLAALTPRFEFKKIEAAFPIALQNDYSVLTVGTMIRIANFFVGSDNIGGAFNIGNPYGANIYMGFTLLPILKRNKKDKDNDGVSNSKDLCKKIPGTLALMGCPDRDKDGVADKDDACPDVAGSVMHQGCPPPAETSKTPAIDSLSVPASDSVNKKPIDLLYKLIPETLKTPLSDSIAFPAFKPTNELEPDSIPVTIPADSIKTTPVKKLEDSSETKMQSQLKDNPEIGSYKTESTNGIFKLFEMQFQIISESRSRYLCSNFLTDTHPTLCATSDTIKSYYRERQLAS
jgi:hypothetical protein